MSGVVSLNSWRLAATFLPTADMLEGTWTGVEVEGDEEVDEFEERDGLRVRRGDGCVF